MPPRPAVYRSPVGMKRYEPSNNPGNVMTVISDKITPIDTTSDGLWDYFNPSLVSATDYYPFGMGMPGRYFNDGSYEYGFNGKRIDNEVYGTGNSYDFDARMYNTRLVLFPSTDPKFKFYPGQSPYSAFNGNPIFFTDPTGKDGVAYWDNSRKTKTLVIKADYHYIKGQFDESVLAAVQKEYGSYKKINYNGETVNVRFEIGFQVHVEGADLNSYDGTNGQNRLIKETISQPDFIELSHYQQVEVDVDKINGSSVNTPDGRTVSLSSKDKFEKQVSTIAHGIGHNIGLIHDDEGIMLDQMTTIYQEPDLLDPSKTTYRPDFNPNHVTKTNTQNLSNRISEMTKQGRDYWKGKKDKGGNDLKDHGIIKMQEK